MDPSCMDSSRESKYGCPRKTYLSRMSSVNANETDSSPSPSGLDILANIASPKHHRVHVDSFSNVSLPDEMRISFSESEFQLDDVDFSYSPANDVDLTNANIVSVDTISELDDNKELENFQESISSTSCFKNSESILKKQLDASKVDISQNLDETKDGKTPLRNSVTTDVSQFSFQSEIENQFQQDERKGETVNTKTWNRNVQASQVSTVGSSREVSNQSLVSPRRGSKVKHAINVPCQVCSDNAAGFYCGAYICEACKKFYMRAYKQDKMKYVCLRDKNCVITKESRVQCQYCRFQKCVQLNMYCPKAGDGDANKDSSMSEIPCRVCSAPSSGFHFGAITCEGCKGFFRRMAKEREPEKYQCTKKGDCEINMLTRNLCKACRYQQCIKAGMSVQGSRIGRQPNSVKHLISMELKNQVKSEPGADNFGYTGMEDCGVGIDIKIKDEPVDFLDSSNNMFDCIKNFQQTEPADKPNSLNSGDIVVTHVSNQQTSASAHDTVQPVNKSYMDTSSSASVNSVVFPPKRKLSPLQPYYGLNVSESEPGSLTNFIPSHTMSSRLEPVIEVGENPAVSLPGQVPVHSISISGPAPSVSMVGRVPPIPLSGRIPAMTIKDQVQAGSISNQLPGVWNQQQFQSHDQKLNLVQPVSNLPGSRNLVSPCTNKQISPTLSQNGGTQAKQWQNGRETERKSLNYGLYDFPIDRSTFGDNNDSKQTQSCDAGPGLSAVNADILSKLWDQSNINKKLDNSTKNTSQDQLMLDREDWNPTKPKKSRQQNKNYSMEAKEIDSGLSLTAQPMYSLGRNGGDKKRGDDNFESNMDMPDFIKSIIEAGKCLQLLNYRVFDTDLNPTSSMNVDEIKNIFKMKNVDPKAGNRITSSVNMSMFDSKESTWNYMMTNFHHNTYITIRFAKMVPGFKTLTLNDQVKLIQNTIYPIELLNMSKVYDPVTKQYNYFTYTKEEESIMMTHFPMLRVFQEHFLHVGEMVTTFNLTDEEFALLSALLLFPAEISGLEDPKAVEDLQNKVTGALQYYEENRMPDGLTRFGILLVRVAELIQCLLQHNLAIGLLLTHNPTIKVPQLFHELIIESIKEGQRT